MCQNSCPANIYFLNGTINQCNATCALPFGVYSTSLGSSNAHLCSTCSQFVQRSNSSCVTSCIYINSTSVNSSAVTICETGGDSTYCPTFVYLNATAYTCQSSTCPAFYIGGQCYSSCPPQNPLISGSGSKQCIDSCPTNIYQKNGSLLQCNATC